MLCEVGVEVFSFQGVSHCGFEGRHVLQFPHPLPVDVLEHLCLPHVREVQPVCGVLLEAADDQVLHRVRNRDLRGES